MGAIHQALLAVSGAGGGGGGYATPPTEASWDLWLRPDQEIFTDSGATTPAVADGDRIFHWRNVKNTGHQWTQLALGVRPTLRTNVVNGNPVVRFVAASSERLTGNAGFAFSSANTFFIVTIKSGVTDSYVVSGDGGEGGPAIISRFSSKDFEYFFDSSGERGTFAASTDTNFHVLMVRRTDDSGNYELGFDGPIVVSSAVSGGNDWNGRKISQLATYVGGGNFYTGDIAEIINCNSSLSNSKANEFLDYFSASYGISITHLP